MTVRKAFDLQQAVYEVLASALPGVQIFSYPPEPAPARHCRIDGFAMAANEAYKNREQGDHTLTVHLIEAPPGGSLSLAWVRAQASAAHDALKVLRLDEKSLTLTLVAAGAALEPREDKVRDAHAFLRYTTTIGD